MENELKKVLPIFLYCFSAVAGGREVWNMEF
jgi:hypothetical protein